MRIYLDKNVLDAGIERINYVFDEFPDVIVWVSGGKDSTVIYNLTYQIAKERNRLPLKVAFIDQESEWQSTIDMIRYWMYNPDTTPLWYQVPFKLNNSTSFSSEWLYVWDEKEKNKWPREKEPIAVKENRYGVDLFMELFEAILDTDFKDERIGSISGVRCEESPGRFAGLTSSNTYKGVTWGRKYKNKNHINFYPIYDWSISDVWKYIHDSGVKYNDIYTQQYKVGMPLQNMRVSSLHHETSLRSIFYMQEVEPETFNKLINRMTGINTAKQMNTDFYAGDLPFMFKSWKEYRDYLLEKLIDKKYQDNFRSWFVKQDLEFEDVNDKLKYKKIASFDSICKAQIDSILCNDFELTKIKNIQQRNSNKETRKLLEERKKHDEGCKRPPI
jgi:predicted phosphoadenosine phosphosulfate sulfurtransferase